MTVKTIKNVDTPDRDINYLTNRIHKMDKELAVIKATMATEGQINALYAKLTKQLDTLSYELARKG